jgi:hypothetical protein
VSHFPMFGAKKKRKKKKEEEDIQQKLFTKSTKNKWFRAKNGLVHLLPAHFRAKVHVFFHENFLSAYFEKKKNIYKLTKHQIFVHKHLYLVKNLIFIIFFMRNQSIQSID